MLPISEYNHAIKEKFLLLNNFTLKTLVTYVHISDNNLVGKS